MEAVGAIARDFEGNAETLEAAVRSCERTARTHNRSFFLKKLEQHLMDKGVKVPEQIFRLFDTPFMNFTPEYARVYEEKIKGQALFHVFSDMLVEIYERIEADRVGWEAAANYLEDTPMKVCALHTLVRIKQLEEIPEDCDYLDLMDEFSGVAQARVTPQVQKLNVKTYANKDKSRRRKRDTLKYYEY